jgi:V8-like Glu-specific endopeptidase
MSRKFHMLPAAGCALVLLCTPLSAAAHPRRRPRLSAALAHRIEQLRVNTSRHRVSHLHLVSQGRATAGSRPRIIGGYGAVQSDWPFMAFVAHFDASGNADFTCSGTVVSPNVVLTAGHCAVDETTGLPLDPSGFRVVTGSVDWTDTAQRQISPVSRVIVNPAYDPAIADTTDAALLVLSTPTTAPGIPLATGADEYLELGGTGAVIAGWGATYDGGAPQTYLQWASTVVQPPGYCSGLDSSFDPSAELCAVNPPDFLTGTCNGDSGGPLATDDASGQLIEIGVITWGPADCNTSTADYFTNVIPIESWAAGWINAVAPPPPPPAPPPPTPSPPPIPPSAPTSAQPNPPSLPTLTVSQARSYVRQTIAGALGHRAKPAHRYRAKCSRQSSTRFTCAVQFWHGPNDYYGSVTVYLVSGPNGLTEWTDHYTLHWVNDQCYFQSGHPRTCTIHTRRGTW